MSRKLGAVLAAAAMVLSACGGGGGGGRPSVEELSTAFQEGSEVGGEEFSMTEDQADCAAKAFHDSELSDEALTALVEMEEDYDASEKDTKALESVSSEDMTKCILGQ